MIQDENLTLHSLWNDLFAVVRRRKALVGVVALATVIAVYVGLSFVSDQYQAQASLLVKLGRENAQVPVTVEKGSVFSSGVSKEEVNSYIALFTSRPLLESTVDEIGLERFKDQPRLPKSIFGYPKFALKSLARMVKKSANQILIWINLRPDLSEKELALIGRIPTSSSSRCASPIRSSPATR
jgi:uncharacterized protein involved in exopolysaccharide biosynthesis